MREAAQKSFENHATVPREYTCVWELGECKFEPIKQDSKVTATRSEIDSLNNLEPLTVHYKHFDFMWSTLLFAIALLAPAAANDEMECPDLSKFKITCSADGFDGTGSLAKNGKEPKETG